MAEAGPKSSTVFPPDEPRKGLWQLARENLNIGGWAFVTLIAAGAVLATGYGVYSVQKWIEELANNPLGNVDSQSGLGPTSSTGVSPEAPPVPEPAAAPATNSAPTKDTVVAIPPPPEVESDRIDHGKPRLNPRAPEQVADETAKLNLEELAKHADRVGVIEKDGVKYDVWKSKDYGLTHHLPHSG